MKRWHGAALAAISITALSACTDSKPAATTTPRPTATAAASPSPSVYTAADTYDGAQRLVGGLNEAGIACINWESIDNPVGAIERGSCYVGEQQVLASIYASADEAAGAPEVQHATLAGVSDTVMVVGGNWTLSCDLQTLCSQISTQFGGKLVVLPA